MNNSCNDASTTIVVTHQDAGNRPHSFTSTGWLVGWGLTAFLTQNRSYRACKFVGIFHSSKL